MKTRYRSAMELRLPHASLLSCLNSSMRQCDVSVRSTHLLVTHLHLRTPYSHRCRTSPAQSRSYIPTRAERNQKSKLKINNYMTPVMAFGNSCSPHSR